MDATRLPAVAPVAPVVSAPATTPSVPAVTAPDQPTPVGGRFVPVGISVSTPTGIVGEATDINSGATVLLKQVPDAVLPTTAMSDRALRELKQLAKVTSDRIVRVVDQGRGSDGHVYVATEKVEAISLEELIAREGPLAVERAKSIVLQVGEALTEAQKVGVIHRDVSPRNVLVLAGDHVKVADFGLAEPVVAPSGEAAKVFGAPSFLSPEQAEGKPVDQRSNIYSLGAIYYFALTGAPPFAGDAVSLLQQHLNTPPAPPSTKRVGLGSEIDRVILKALEKNGGRRHLTLRQLLNEVQSATERAAGPLRSDAQAKTFMSDAPPAPSPSQPHAPVAQPQRAGAAAATMMGIPAASPVAAMGPPQKSTLPPLRAEPPAVTAPSMPAVPMAEAVPHRISSVPHPLPSVPPQAAPEQRTMLAEARPQAQPYPQPQSHAPPSEARTVMAEPRAAAPVAAPAKPGNNTGKKGAFRETAWFKRGEIEEELAKRQAAVDPASPKTGTTGEHAPVDENAVPLSAQDQQRLSLKTGATQAMPVIKAQAQALPGERMDEAEMLAEIDSSRKWFIVAGVIVAAIVIGLIIFFATRSAPAKSEAPPGKPEAVAAAPPTGAPPPAPPPAVATPPAASPPKPAKIATPTAPGAATEALVARLEANPDKAEIRKLERSLDASLKAAKKRKDREVIAQDTQWLLRLRRAATKKK
jgi:serine/threonine protein kinase